MTAKKEKEAEAKIEAEPEDKLAEELVEASELEQPAEAIESAEATEAAEPSEPAESAEPSEEAAEEAAPESGKEAVAEAPAAAGRRGRDFAEPGAEWIPKTKLGNEVLAGKYKSLEEILEGGELILEPEIVDFLIPDVMQEIIYVGGSPGKGGGIRRTATKMTARMHKSGRRFKLTAVAVVGNGNGIVGIGSAISKEHRTALEKAGKNAKLNVIRARRGCGSWECGCGGEHSIPFKVSGKSGSVSVTLLPAPKGVGMVASEETKKILRLAGINDVWVKTAGKTSTRNNLVLAVFDALKNLNKGKGGL